MTGITLLYFIILLVYGIIYTALIFSYTIGWYKLRSFIPSIEKNPVTKASIIIPARDEEANIENLLNDLIGQSISNENYEIIVVDDNSSDKTRQIVSTFISKNPGINILLLEVPKSDHNAPYKKKAIQLAIQNSAGNLIITTDADCRIGKNWLETILTFYEKEKPKMIVGPVSFHHETSAFEKMQTLEFLSLIAITGGAIKIGKPIMCNGANLAYEKEAFYKAGGFGADKFSSGDDVFLLYKIMKMFGNNSVRFIKNYDAIVFTRAKKSVKEFIHQRTRWASKNKGYNAKILFVSSSVYLINLLIVAGLIASIFYAEIFKLLIILLIIKTLIEIPILIGISTFAKRKRIFLYSFPLIFLYPLYIVITGALGILGSYTWKGRAVKN
jgi:cellulose synthase/poly-beta-1,6-N-acetylglucosamine synthase-like glycosyltransferase